MRWYSGTIRMATQRMMMARMTSRTNPMTLSMRCLFLRFAAGYG
jgi:hypothetical protein